MNKDFIKFVLIISQAKIIKILSKASKVDTNIINKKDI